MRVGFLGPFSSLANSDYGSTRQVGAIEQQILGIGAELVSLGHEVFVTRSWHSSPAEHNVNGVRILNVGAIPTRGDYNPRSPLRILEVSCYLAAALGHIARLDADFVVVPGVLPAFASSSLFRRGRQKKVFLAINNDIFTDGSLGQSSTPGLTRFLLGAINRRYDATVAVTQGGREYLLSHGIKCDHVVPLAVNPDNYATKADESFILTASRLVPHKRIDDLLHALLKASERIPAKLVIVGSGPEKAAIEALIHRMGLEHRVELRSFLPQPVYRDLLSRCSFFVLPSQAETLGVVMLEAMASGKPVIARDIIGPRDVITPDWDGYLFRNREDLEKYISILAARPDLRLRMGSRARETVEQHYTFRAAARILEESLFSLAGGNDARSERDSASMGPSLPGGSPSITRKRAAKRHEPAGRHLWRERH